jgi:hypothetical protein
MFKLFRHPQALQHDTAVPHNLTVMFRFVRHIGQWCNIPIILSYALFSAVLTTPMQLTLPI